MDCSFQYNNRGEIVKVLDKQGNESILYKTIAKHLLIEDALATYKNIFTDKFKDLEENQINFTHRVGDETFSSFKEALEVAQENSTIKVGFEVDGKFTELLSITKNTELTNELGFIQAGLLNDLIATEKVLVGNSYRLQANGVSESKKTASMSILKNIAALNLGSQSLQTEGMTFTVTKTFGKETVFDKEGNKVTVDKADINTMSEQELRAKYDNVDDIIFERYYKELVPVKRNLPTNEPIIKTDAENVENLLSILKKMGITVNTLDNYNTNFEIKNGVNPNAEAWADIANQVVGISAGYENIENLLEETVHFIVEALPQTRIENILRNINKSEEYKQHYEIQRAIYSDEYAGQELEDVVNREILGKIIVNALSQTEEKSPTQQNFFENAKRLISEFFQDIINYFKPQYVQELNSVVEDIQDMLDSQDIGMLELNNFKGNNKRFYNIGGKSENDKIVISLKKGIGVLQRQANNLIATNNNSPTTRAELKRIEKSLDEEIDAHSVRSLVQIVENYTNQLNAAIKDSKDNDRNYTLTPEEEVIYKNLTKEVTPTLGEVKNVLQNEAKYKDDKWNPIIEAITKVEAGVSDMVASRAVSSENTFQKLFNKLTVERGMSEKDAVALLAWHERAQSENNIIHQTFGTLGNSSDLLANLFSTTATATYGLANRTDHNELKKFQEGLNKLGFDERWVSGLAKDHYFLSEVDFVKYNAELDKIFLEEYKAIVKNNLTDEEILKRRDRNTLEWSDSEQEYIKQQVEDRAREEQDSRMNDAYNKEYEKNIADNNISKETQKVLRSFSTEYNLITAQARNKDGQIDYQLLRPQDRIRKDQLDLSRKQVKSYVDELGELKQGLELVDGEIILLEGASPEATLAFEINKLDSTFKKSVVSEEVPQAFLDFLDSKSNLPYEEQLYALYSNSNIGMTDDYWEQVEKNQEQETAIDIAIKNAKGNTKLLNEINSLVEERDEIQFKLRNIKKVYSDKNNPIELNVEAMSQLTKDKVIILETELGEIQAELRLKTEGIKINPQESLIDSKLTTNKAWESLIADYTLNNPDAPISSILNLAKQNMTAKNADMVDKTRIQVGEYQRGKVAKLSKSIKSELERQGIDEKDLINPTISNQFLKTYAENRLASYYKRYSTQGYLDFQQALNNQESLSSVLSRVKDFEYLRISPNYSFLEEDKSNINPNYIVNSGFGAVQPKLSKYGNKEFAERFGVVTRNTDGTFATASKNQKEFEAYKLTIEFRKNQLKTLQAAKSYNIFTTPPVRRNLTERWLELRKTLSNFKGTWQELTQYVEDDQELGDVRFGTDGLTIPKRYLQPLQNKEDQSTDIFTALTMVNTEANLYASRIKHYGDFKSIMDAVENRSYGDVEASSTNRYKMIQSAWLNDVMGVKQARSASFDLFGNKVEAAKVVNTISSFTGFKGLAFNPIIATTALLTGGAKIVVERAVQQYVNKDSFRQGRIEASKLMNESMAEAGKIRTTGRLNAIGQFFGAFEREGSLRGSKFNPVSRFAPRLGMCMFQAASYPLYTTGLMSTLCDFRVVNGRILKFTDYQRAERRNNVDITNNEIQKNWEKETTTIFSLLENKDSGEVSLDKSRLLGILKNADGSTKSSEEVDETIAETYDDIRMQVRNINSRIDLQLPHEEKVKASRDFLTNFLLQFKKFMIPLWEERFKPQKPSVQSRQLESGSYSGIWIMANDIVKEYRSNGGKIMEAFKKQYYGDTSYERVKLKKIQERLKGVDEKNYTEEDKADIKELKDIIVGGMELHALRRQNLQRLGIDMLLVNSLIALVLVLRNYADEPDQEDNYALQMVSLLTYRLASEVHGSSTGIVKTYVDVASSPFQSAQQLVDISKLLDKKSYDEGNVAKSLGRVLPFAGSYSQMSSPITAYDNKVYYNEVKDDVFTYLPLYYLLNPDKNDE